MPVTEEDYAAMRARDLAHAAGPHAFVGGSAQDGEAPGICGWCHKDHADPRHVAFELVLTTLDPERPVDHRSHAKTGALLPADPSGKTYLLCGCGAIFRIEFGQHETQEVTDPEIKSLVIRTYEAIDRVHKIGEVLTRKLHEIQVEFGHG